MNLTIRPRSDGEIRAIADAFRRQHLPADAQTPPIDPLLIAEIQLRLNPIALPGLFKDLGIDAAILPDLTGLYVDEDAYMAWEAERPPWVERRLRFSIAHELGHLEMHGDVIRTSRFSSLAEFKQWALNGGAHSSAEYQANEFAGRLLVPVEILQDAFLEYARRAETFDPQWRSIPGLRQRAAEQLAPRFGVNWEVISKRLHREGLWPEPES
jgi:Zn-dependent peptidase ImmA (M78 family)